MTKTIPATTSSCSKEIKQSSAVGSSSASKNSKRGRPRSWVSYHPNQEKYQCVLPVGDKQYHVDMRQLSALMTKYKRCDKKNQAANNSLIRRIESVSTTKPCSVSVSHCDNFATIRSSTVESLGRKREILEQRGGTLNCVSSDHGLMTRRDSVTLPSMSELLASIPNL